MKGVLPRRKGSFDTTRLPRNFGSSGNNKIFTGFFYFPEGPWNSKRNPTSGPENILQCLVM